MSSPPDPSPLAWQNAPTLGFAYQDPYTYTQLERYYAGQQPLAYLAPEVASHVQGRLKTLIVNWPRLVIDALEERLDVTGFRLGPDLPADSGLAEIWENNDLDEASQQAHVEALLHGRAYALVWADDMLVDDRPFPRVSIESSAQMAVRWQPGTTNITQAVKLWFEDELAYATLYLPDRIERYVAPATAVQTADLVLTSSAWELREEPISHDLGLVPVVPFVNRPTLMRPFGESEIADIIPLADAVNKLATDMMVSAEYHAMPRRYATGVEMGPPGVSRERAREEALQNWSNAEAGRAWLSSNPNARFGQFAEAQLTNFVEAMRLLTEQVAALAGLPPHMMGLTTTANPASADAIRSAEASLVKRALRKQRVFGGSWERVMRLALLVRDGRLPANILGLETMWRSVETQTVAQKVDAAVKMIQVGLPFSQALEDLDYTPEQQKKIMDARTSGALAQADAQLRAVDLIVQKYGLSKAAALAVVGLDVAAQLEAKVEVRQPAVESELTLGGLEPVPADVTKAP